MGRRTPPKPPAPPVAMLTHSPSPGLYSRLERAVEQLPKEVKIEGLENRLKKSKEGVSQWEVNPFLESLFQSEESLGRTIPRGQLLDHVYEASPAFTHTEKVLQHGDSLSQKWGDHIPLEGGKLGDGAVVGRPQYSSHREPGTENYREILLQQPGASQIKEGSALAGQDPAWQESWSGGHWGKHPNTIAHARIGDRGDALRIAEVQSDVRNQNVRQQAHGNPEIWDPQLFPLYDHYPEVLGKSILLKAAREGKRAVEIPDLAWLQDNTNMRPAGVQHVYGGQVPGTLIRAGRPLGGLIDEGPQAAATKTRYGHSNDFFLSGWDEAYVQAEAARTAARRLLLGMTGVQPAGPFVADPARHAVQQFIDQYPPAHFLHRHTENLQRLRGRLAFNNLNSNINEVMPQVAALMQQYREATAAVYNAPPLGPGVRDAVVGTSRRLVIPDEVRRKIIQGGIGLGVLAPLLGGGEQGQPGQQERR